MRLTAKLKSWLVDNGGVKADASDDEFRAAAAKAITEGTLSTEKLHDLQKDPDAEAAEAFEKRLEERITQSVSAGIAAGMKSLSGVKAKAEDDDEEEDEDDKNAADDEANPGMDDAESPENQGDGKSAGKGKKGKQAPAKAPKLEASQFEKALGQTGSGERAPGQLIRVRGAHERYDSTKSAARYPERDAMGRRHKMGGQQVRMGQRSLDMPSQRDHAINAAWFKWHIFSQLPPQSPMRRHFRPNEEEQDLMQHALKSERWAGVLNGDCDSQPGAVGVKGRRLTESEIKTIVDDTTSGGLEIAPIMFDDAVILFPVLFGELFPDVNVVEVTRGRRIEGASISTPTITSGGSVTDNTLIPLESTASFITAFDTTIFVAHGAIEIGLDLLSDTPIALAEIVSQKYGEAMLEWLDEQIAIGDGSTEPEGVMNASSTTSVSFGSAAPTVGGYESLLFGVPKRYKQGGPMQNVVFASNETSYSRARAIAVGSSDARRVFGLNEENYQLFGHPYKINEAMANTQAFFAVMRRYRMYRRMGTTLSVTTEGRELTLRNKMLLSLRARWGGNLEDGRAAAISNTLQS